MSSGTCQVCRQYADDLMGGVCERCRWWKRNNLNKLVGYFIALS